MEYNLTADLRRLQEKRNLLIRLDVFSLPDANSGTSGDRVVFRFSFNRKTVREKNVAFGLTPAQSNRFRNGEIVEKRVETRTTVDDG